MGPHGPGARPWSAAVGWAQPRSRREALLLASLVLITLFFSARLWQLHPRGPAAALAGHTVLRRFFVQEPTVVTEVIINRRPVRPQPGAGAGSKDAGRLESRIHAAIRPHAREPEAATRPAAISQDGVHRVAWPASAGAPPLPGIPLESSDAQWPVARPAKDTDALFRASLAKRKQPQRLRGAPVEGAAEGPKQRLPQDFDWRTYLLYQPELRYSGITTEELAKRHYLDFGRAEGRIYKRLRVLLRYTACTGLINQHYSHIASISLAAVLGAEVVLPPAVKRDSFAHYFSTVKENNQVAWTPAPLDSLLDVDKVIDFWSRRGLILHQVRAWHGRVTSDSGLGSSWLHSMSHMHHSKPERGRVLLSRVPAC